MGRTSKTKRAVKIIKKEMMNDEERKSFKTEMATLKKLDHPNILKLYEVFEDSKKYFLVTEYCKGGELFEEIVSKVTFSEHDAAQIISQVLKGIAYCHGLGIVHRDLKPENLLIDKEQDSILKIIDFGTSVEYDKTRGDRLNAVHGTSYYIAPEVLKMNYDERCDVWSIGVIMYILLSGKPPFDGKSDKDITAKVSAGQYSMEDPIWGQISDQAKNLIRQMLTVDFKKRIYARQALQHEWFKGASTAPVVDRTLMREALDNLKGFSATQKLQQATLSMMVQNMVTKEEQGRLQKVFIALDVNQDGYLQYDELLQGFTDIYGEEYAKEEVDRIFALVDVDHSGEIDFSEFVTASVNKGNLLQENKLKAAFEYYDRDKSGSISVDEIKDVLGVGKNISKEVWD